MATGETATGTADDAPTAGAERILMQLAEMYDRLAEYADESGGRLPHPGYDETLH